MSLSIENTETVEEAAVRAEVEKHASQGWAAPHTLPSLLA
jgi:NADH pyrophosphatase NudC (nudix superfamily)